LEFSKNSVAEDLGGGGGEDVEGDGEVGVLREVLSGGVGDILQAEQSQIARISGQCLSRTWCDRGATYWLRTVQLPGVASGYEVITEPWCRVSNVAPFFSRAAQPQPICLRGD
jgi:hypothetical protein